MNELTNEEKETLKRLRQDYEKDRRENKGQGSHISTPEKYSFPIGMDDKGNLFPLKEDIKPKK